MIELHGPAPENMKPGEVYTVIKDKKRGGLELLKVGNDDNVVVLHMPRNIHKIFEIEAILSDSSVEERILEDLNEQITASLDEVYGDWIRRTYEEKPGPSS